MISEPRSWAMRTRTYASEHGRVWSLGWVSAGLALMVISAAVSLRMQFEIAEVFDREDVRALEQSQRTFDAVMARELVRLRSQVAVLAEDARVRSTVATREFDETSVADVLADLKKSTGADVLAILDVTGRVRAATGADEVLNQDLGTSSLIKAGLAGPATSLWTFSENLRLVGVAPIQFGDQVLAVLMIGFNLDPATLADIGAVPGAFGGAFVGEVLAASSSADAQTRALLIAAGCRATRSQEWKRDEQTLVVQSFRPRQTAGAARIVWGIPKHHLAGRMTLLRWFSWTPTLLVGLGLLLLTGLAWRERTRGT